MLPSPAGGEDQGIFRIGLLSGVLVLYGIEPSQAAAEALRMQGLCSRMVKGRYGPLQPAVIQPIELHSSKHRRQ